MLPNWLIALTLILTSSFATWAQHREMTVREVRNQVLSEISHLRVVLCDREISSPAGKLEIIVQVQRATKTARCELVRSLQVEMEQVFDLNSSNVENSENLAELLHDRYMKITRQFVKDFFAAEKKVVDRAFQKPDLSKDEKQALFFQFDVAREKNIQMMNERLVLLGEFIRQLDQIKITPEPGALKSLPSQSEGFTSLNRERAAATSAQ
jgi:hypothetical protein